jgi:hypothetical protein
MGEVIAAIQRFVDCKHKEAHILGDGGSGLYQWCPDCGALKAGVVWTNSRALEMVKQFKSLLGL